MFSIEEWNATLALRVAGRIDELIAQEDAYHAERARSAIERQAERDYLEKRAAAIAVLNAKRDQRLMELEANRHSRWVDYRKTGPILRQPCVGHDPEADDVEIRDRLNIGDGTWRIAKAPSLDDYDKM